MTSAVAGGDTTAGVGFIELGQKEDLRYLQQAMGSDPAVEFANPVPIRYLHVASEAEEGEGAEAAGFNVPPPAALMWNLRKIEWAQARALPNAPRDEDTRTIRVGVLDTGVDTQHPDLAGNVTDYHYIYPNLPTSPSGQDIVGHGTHVSGTIAAKINNNVGINGICTPALSVWKIFNDQPTYFQSSNIYSYLVDPVLYRRALAECIGNTEVINLSIGGTGVPDPLELTLYQQLIQSNVTVVAAMGNWRQQGSPTSYPGAIPGVIAAGATDIADRVASFSNSGRHITLCAPGVAIWSTQPTYPGQSGFQALRNPAGDPAPGMPLRRETNYAASSGTSMAAPHVTAAAALLQAQQVAAGAALSPAQVRTDLANTADKVPGMGGADFTPDYGFGRLNLQALLA